MFELAIVVKMVLKVCEISQWKKERKGGWYLGFQTTTHNLT
jgi:hypothetical protein